jgi:hypothetical protein
MNGPHSATRFTRRERELQRILLELKLIRKETPPKSIRRW